MINYFIYFVLTMMILRSALNVSFNRFSGIRSQLYTSNQLANNMLLNNNIHNVSIGFVEGHLTDHYDTNTRTVYLSEAVNNSNSLPALAVAAHEIGHAIQHNQRKRLFMIHNNLSYIVAIGSRFTRFFIYIGFLFGIEDLLSAGLLLLFITFLFQILSIPIEIDASRIGFKEIKNNGYVSDNNVKFVKIVFLSALMTYFHTVLYTPINTLRPFPK